MRCLSGFYMMANMVPPSYSRVKVLQKTLYRIGVQHVQTICCQNENAPQFGSKVISEVSQLNVDLDLGNKLLSPAELQNNLKARRLKHINIHKLAMSYSKWMTALSMQKSVEIERQSLSKKYQEKVKQNKSKEEVEEFKKSIKEQAKKFKNELLEITKSVHDLERETQILGFGLPNNLHPKTPVDTDEVQDESGSPESVKKCISHLELARRFNLIKCRAVGDRAFYFIGKLAEFEQELLSWFSSHLEETGLTPISTPDFFKDFVIEGSGINPEKTYRMLQPHVDSDVHYGIPGASVTSFAAFLTKMSISQKMLPLEYFSSGPCYTSGFTMTFKMKISNKSSLTYSVRHKFLKEKDSTLPGLFSASQSSKINIFGVYKNIEECHDSLEKKKDMMYRHYTQLNVPLRLVLVPAHLLKLSEEIRYELQIWTSSLQTYIPVAFISSYGDYISRRLMIKNSSNQSHLYMVYGEMLDTTRLVAVLSEYGNVINEIYHLPELQPLQQHKLAV